MQCPLAADIYILRFMTEVSQLQEANPCLSTPGRAEWATCLPGSLEQVHCPVNIPGFTPAGFKAVCGRGVFRGRLGQRTDNLPLYDL